MPRCWLCHLIKQWYFTKGSDLSELGHMCTVSAFDWLSAGVR